MSKEEQPDSEGQEIRAGDDETTCVRREKEGNTEADESADYQKYIREKLGPLLSGGMWFFIDVKYIVPDSYQMAWWVFIGWWIFQSIEATWLFKTLRAGCIASAGFLLIGIIGGSILIPPTPLQETETHGWLVPANDPMPTNNSCKQSKLPQDARFFHLGPVVYWYKRDETIRHKTLVAIRHDPLLAFSREGDKLAISGDVLDVDGNVVAVIGRNNEFHLVYGQYAYADRPDRSTLRIIGHKKQELLYIRFANTNTVEFRGTFPIPDKSKAPKALLTESAQVDFNMNVAGTVIISDSDIRMTVANTFVTIKPSCAHLAPNVGMLNFGN